MGRLMEHSTDRTRYTSMVKQPAPDRPVTLIYGRGTMSFGEAVRSLEISPIVARYGDWVVTTYGLECLATYYVIPVDRLWGEWTLRHMSTKAWIVYEDFTAAYEAARAHHGRKTPPASRPPRVGNTPRVIRRPQRQSLSTRLRFIVLRRDRYACQMCGRSAQQGYQMQIDHKLARSKGGSDELDNLWVLCSLCNNGKGTEEL